jgi:AcrR family transcriptional regulator
MARALPMAPDDRRAHLLAAARSVFASLGYHRASVSSIISEAGVARGTFYNYFDSKRSCFQAVLEEVTKSVAGAVLPIDVAGDIPGQVRQNLARLLAALTENDEVQRVLFAEAAGIDEEGDEGLRGFYRGVTKRLATAIATGQSLGVVTEGSPLILARLLLGMIREPVFQAWLYGETLDVEAVVDALGSVMRDGMVRR